MVLGSGTLLRAKVECVVPTDGGRVVHDTRHVSNDEVVTETESYSKVIK